MKVLITAGPTREYIDSVRFISNASSGRMGAAVAGAAIRAGWEVVVLLADCLKENLAGEIPQGVKIETFVSVEDLKAGVHRYFAWSDVLVMAAAVGDFCVVNQSETKLSRKLGRITLELEATEDILGSLIPLKRQGQWVVAFAVEDGPVEQIEAKVRDELQRKGADAVVVNTPHAFEARESRACILARSAVVLPWANRKKKELAEEIVKFLSRKPESEI